MLADKATFPRVKLCGGLFTKKGQDCLHEILSPEAYDDCMKESLMGTERNFALWNEYDLMVRVQLQNDIVLIDRPRFDNFLVQHFKSNGGTMLESDAVKASDVNARKAAFESGRVVVYQRLVAGDGVNSTVAHLLAKADKRYKLSNLGCFCLEVNIDKEDCDIEDINIHFNLVPDFYTWAFRKGDKVCIGLGNLASRKLDLKAVLLDFMKKVGVRNIEKYPIRGAIIPSEVRPSEWKKDNVMFVGDAGGFVELLTYEGIYYALRSGSYAAQSIIKGESYTKLVKPIYNKMKHGGFFQKLIYWKPFLNLFIKHAGNHGRFIARFYSENIDNIPTEPLWHQVMMLIVKPIKVMLRR